MTERMADRIDELVGGIGVTLFALVLLYGLFAVVPEPESCWIPPNASTRGFYRECWGFWELWK